jgi:hypothetical protein
MYLMPGEDSTAPDEASNHRGPPAAVGLASGMADGKAALLPALVCAGLSVALMRSGFLSFCFLVPVGYAAIVRGAAAAWFAAVVAALLNIAVSLGLAVMYRGGVSGAGLDILYFTVMSLGGAWFMAGGGLRIAYRSVIAAAAGAVVLTLIGYVTRNEPGVAGLLHSQVEKLSSVYIEALGADAARRSALERLLTPEQILETVTAIVLKGGALAAAFFMLFVNRQLAVLIARFRRRQPAGVLAAFHAPSGAIWVLSLSLAAIPLSRATGKGIPEILAWNVLVACVILFLAQGMGIVMYVFTLRPRTLRFRVFCGATVVLTVFTPGMNMFWLGVVLLLGIAEIWLPLRRYRPNGPASTPGL